MELVPIVLLVWRRRLAFAIGIVLAVAAGLALARGPATHEGVASARLVLDTPVSQLVEAAPKGADSLGWRTELLSDLLTTARLRGQVASAAGVPVQKLAVVNPVLNNPVLPTTLPRRASEVAAGVEEPYVLTVLADGTLPVLSLQGRAPSRVTAARLVGAATAVLKAAAALPPQVPGTQPVVVQQAGSIRAEEKPGGGRKKNAAMGFVAVLLLSWSTILLAPAALAKLRGGARGAHLA